MRSAAGVRLDSLLLIACALLSTACSGGAAPAAVVPALSMTQGMAEVSDARERTDSLGSTIVAIAAPGSMTERPLAADALADSVGINTHTATLYAQPDFETDVTLLQSLGVRHLRDGVLQYSDYAGAMSHLLNVTGASVDVITDCAGLASNPATITTPAFIAQFDAAIGNRVEDVEGPNEPDTRNDVNWAADTKACLPALRTALPQVPFIGPGLGSPLSNATSLGDISALVTDGNIHRYFAGNNPGTSGWGGQSACGTYGALLWAICEAHINTNPNSLYVTESGYASPNEVDDATQAKYLSRLFLVNLKAGIGRSYIYDFKDDPTDTSVFANDGLIRADDSAKPSYTAVQSELSLFSDRGTASTPAQITYSLSNRNIDHLLFQKRDGTYILALWNETSSWNTTTNAETSVAAQSETIVVPSILKSVKAQSLDDSGSLLSEKISTAGMMASVTVDDHVTFVSFKL